MNCRKVTIWFYVQWLVEPLNPKAPFRYISSLFFDFMSSSFMCSDLSISAQLYFSGLALPLVPALYQAPDWLSVRWMCAFPGQMAVLLLHVPGSHFNTQPSCLAWWGPLPGERALALQSAVSMWVCAANCMHPHLFCEGVHPRTLYNQYTGRFIQEQFLF